MCVCHITYVLNTHTPHCIVRLIHRYTLLIYIYISRYTSTYRYSVRSAQTITKTANFSFIRAKMGFFHDKLHYYTEQSYSIPCKLHRYHDSIEILHQQRHTSKRFRPELVIIVALFFLFCSVANNFLNFPLFIYPCLPVSHSFSLSLTFYSNCFCSAPCIREIQRNFRID